MQMPSFNIFILSTPEQVQQKTPSKGKVKTGKNKLKKALVKDDAMVMNVEILNELKKLTSSSPTSSHAGGV